MLQLKNKTAIVGGFSCKMNLGVGGADLVPRQAPLMCYQLRSIRGRTATEDVEMSSLIKTVLTVGACLYLAGCASTRGLNDTQQKNVCICCCTQCNN